MIIAAQKKNPRKKRKRAKQPQKKIEEISEMCQIVEYVDVDVDVYVEQNLDDFEDGSVLIIMPLFQID